MTEYNLILISVPPKWTSNYLRFTTTSIEDIATTYVYSPNSSQAIALVHAIISTAVLNSIDQNGAQELFVQCKDVDG